MLETGIIYRFMIMTLDTYIEDNVIIMACNICILTPTNKKKRVVYTDRKRSERKGSVPKIKLKKIKEVSVIKAVKTMVL